MRNFDIQATVNDGDKCQAVNNKGEIIKVRILSYNLRSPNLKPDIVVAIDIGDREDVEIFTSFESKVYSSYVWKAWILQNLPRTTEYWIVSWRYTDNVADQSIKVIDSLREYEVFIDSHKVQLIATKKFTMTEGEIV